METIDILKKVRKIEIKTRGLSHQIFAGEYHSAFKGKGMIFSEVREYQYGDSIRNIDWNVTARFNHPYVKVFEEERELTVILVIDVSGSKNFGTNKQLKRYLITEVSAVLAFSAIQNNDKIGVIFFSDKVEKFIPPKKGRQHILRIIRELIDFKPENQGTNISSALKFLTDAIKKRSIAFIISDFVDDNFEDSLKIASRKHDVVALQVKDRREINFPDIGLVKVFDPETNESVWIDTSNQKTRNDYRKWWENHNATIKKIFSKNGIDSVDILTGEDYVKPLINLFKMRGK
ncbi:MAG: DUF58 domain-containing protein [Marinilabiliales bacterium]